MTMSSLVQRQSERQGIFLIDLSPFKRGAGGVKYQPYLFSSSSSPLSHPPIFSSLSSSVPSSLSYSGSLLCHTPACPGIQVKKIILIPSP